MALGIMMIPVVVVRALGMFVFVYIRCSWRWYSYLGDLRRCPKGTGKKYTIGCVLDKWHACMMRGETFLALEIVASWRFSRRSHFAWKSFGIGAHVDQEHTFIRYLCHENIGRSLLNQ